MKYYVIKSGSIRNGRFTGTGSLIIEQFNSSGPSGLVNSVNSVNSYTGTFVADKLIDGTYTQATDTTLVAATVVSGESQPPFYDFARDVAGSEILEQYDAVPEADRVYNGPPGANAFGLWNFVGLRGLDLQDSQDSSGDPKKLLLARSSPPRVTRQGVFFTKFIVAPAQPQA